MAEILGIVKNGLLRLTLASFYAEYIRLSSRNNDIFAISSQMADFRHILAKSIILCRIYDFYSEIMISTIFSKMADFRHMYAKWLKFYKSLEMVYYD